MKKILWLFLTFLGGLGICQAATLNFELNALTFNNYYLEGKEKIYVMYTNNVTKNLMFTLNPYDALEYQKDYQEQTTSLEELESTIQNQIKKSIRVTNQEENYETQMFYYIYTQMLIWKTYHPEIMVEIGEERPIFEGKYALYKNMLEEKVNEIPEWIQDYTIKETLELPKEIGYKISSNDCQIKELEDTYEISNCSNRSSIFVEEEIEDQATLYLDGEKKFLEVENLAQKWQINITKEKIETPEEPIKPEETPSSPIIDTPKKVLTNVPNTLENKVSYLWYLLAILCSYVWLKK